MSLITNNKQWETSLCNYFMNMDFRLQSYTSLGADCDTRCLLRLVTFNEFVKQDDISVQRWLYLPCSEVTKVYEVPFLPARPVRLDKNNNINIFVHHTFHIFPHVWSKHREESQQNNAEKLEDWIAYWKKKSYPSNLIPSILLPRTLFYNKKTSVQKLVYLRPFFCFSL